MKNLMDNNRKSVKSFRSVLETEIKNCEHRCLTESALWTIELFISLTTDLEQVIGDDQNADSVFRNTAIYLFCKQLFTNNEFNRCAHYLKIHIGKQSVLDFLYFYARFKVSLKYLYESEGDWVNNESQRYIHSLLEIKEDLEEFFLDYGTDDPYLLYLHGMVLKKLDLKEEAKVSLIKALNKHEYMWCAWLELVELTNYNDAALPNNEMKQFFKVKVLQLKNDKDECDGAINYLINNGYDRFDALKIDLATVNEQKNNSSYALEIFNEIYEKDPYRIEHLPTFSNVLYLQENHQKLAQLAQDCVKNDRYRPETCCIVGNFYSLRNQHEKAVLYFQRSLKIKPAQSSVWLLSAHEYVELENYNAAVHCYCKAIEHSKSNYRAWYGLGQLYELFKNYKYALICFQHGYELMPSDSRILVALGSIYEGLGRIEEAKTCFYRAHSIGDIEHTALVRLGKLLEKMGEFKDAASTFNLFLEEVQVEGFSALYNLSYANMFLANYHLKHSKNYELARRYAKNCCDIPDSKVIGEDLLRKITSLNKNEPIDAEDVSPNNGLESALMNHIPFDDNFVSNTMNLCLDDGATEFDNEIME